MSTRGFWRVVCCSSEFQTYTRTIFSEHIAIIIDHDVNGAPWRFGASFSGVKVVECLFLLVYSTMGRAVYTEKGSCRHCVDNGLMERELMCSVCQEHKNMRSIPTGLFGEWKNKVTFLSREYVIISMVHSLSLQSTDEQQQTRRLVDEVARKRAAADNMGRGRFVPTQERKTSGQKQKPTKQEEQRKALETLGVNTNQINFNKGGKSRSAVDKAKVSTGTAINVVAAVLNPLNPFSTWRSSEICSEYTGVCCLAWLFNVRKETL